MFVGSRRSYRITQIRVFTETFVASSRHLREHLGALLSHPLRRIHLLTTHALVLLYIGTMLAKA